MSERVEYRIAWRRADGGRLRSKRVRNESDGLRKARFLLGDLDEPDAFACCDGHMCGCGGLTNREKFEEYKTTHGQQGEEGGLIPLADIVWGPVVQTRRVTAWEDKS